MIARNEDFSTESLAAMVNFTPISIEHFASITGLSQSEVVEFFNQEFGSYEAYVQACEDRTPLIDRLQELASEVINNDPEKQ